MIHYEVFEKEALQQAGSAGNDWRHVLPAVPLIFRNRFILTLEQGFSIPESFDMINLCQKLKDKDYDLFLKEALDKKEKRMQKDAGKVNA